MALELKMGEKTAKTVKTVKAKTTRTAKKKTEE